MLKSCLLQASAFVALALCVATTSNAQRTINGDFGPGFSPVYVGVGAAQDSGTVWNKLDVLFTGPTFNVNQGIDRTDLLDSTGASTGIGFTGFYNIFPVPDLRTNNVGNFSQVPGIEAGTATVFMELGADNEYKDLMGDYLFKGGFTHSIINGLDPSKTYDLYLYGQGDQFGQNSKFTLRNIPVGAGVSLGTSYDFAEDDVLTEGIEYVVFRDIEPNGDGTITMEFANTFDNIPDPDGVAQGVAAFNAFQLVEHGGGGFEGLLGDFNNDGAVDAADYTVWRDNLNLPVTLPGDQTPGNVSAEDYIDWAGNYGASGVSTIAVPEPATLSFIAILVATVTSRAPRHARR